MFAPSNPQFEGEGGGVGAIRGRGRKKFHPFSFSSFIFKTLKRRSSSFLLLLLLLFSCSSLSSFERRNEIWNEIKIFSQIFQTKLKLRSITMTHWQWHLTKKKSTSVLSVCRINDISKKDKIKKCETKSNQKMLLMKLKAGVDVRDKKKKDSFAKFLNVVKYT